MNDLMKNSFTSSVDLKKKAMKGLEAGPSDLEMTTNADQDLNQFFDDVGKVKREMDAIRDLLGRLQETNEELKSSHRPETMKNLRNKINAEIVAVQNKARTIRAQLEDLDSVNDVNRRISGWKEGTPIDRTRIAVTSGLRKKLKELMMDFQFVRQKMMAECRDTVQRRYFMVTGEHADEEIVEKIISNGEGEDLLKKAIVEHGRGTIMATVSEIRDRYCAAKEIERNLEELHQIFLDMAVMVEVQGDQMDDIEHNVKSAAHYVKDGTKNQRSAKGNQSECMKWLCIILILVLIFIIVVVIPITTSSLRNS